jgi:CHAT domain-containing protein/tetratricopeptide (TPR) repeat protein
MLLPNLPLSFQQRFSDTFGWLKTFCGLLAFALFSLLFQIFFTASAWSQNQEVLLIPTQTIERTISNGEVHRFRVHLESGQLVSLVLDQKNVDVILTVLKPGQQPLADTNSPYGNRGIESLSFISEEAGNYIIEVRPVNSNLLSGQYNLQVQGFRPPQAAEETRIKTAKLLQEGQKFFEQNTSEGWEQAVSKYQKVIAEWELLGEQQEEVKTFYLMGEAYRRLSKYHEAVEAYRKSLKLAHQLDNQRAEAYAWMRLGHVYLYFDQYEARNSSQKAYDLWEIQGDKINEATTLHNLSGAYDNLGEWQQAATYCERVISLRKELRDWGGVASTLNILGMTCDKLGRPQDALKHYEEALAILRQESNLTLNDQRMIAAILNNIGYVYATLGDASLALDYYWKSLPRRKETRDISGEGATLLNIGQAYTMLGDPEKALGYYGEAQKTSKLLHSEWGEANCLLYSGQALTLIGKTQEALNQYLVALDVFRKLNDRQAEATVLDEIAAIFATQGNIQAALEKYNSALVLWRNMHDPYGEAAALYGVAQLERSRSNIATAHDRATQAIKIVENLRTKVGSQTLRASYLSSIRNYYDLDIDLLMQLHRSQPTKGFDQQAIQISEQGRARSLLESFAEIGKEISKGVAPNLLEKSRSLSVQIEAKSQQIIELNRRQQPEKEIQTAEEALQGLVSQYKNMQEEIRIQSPAYAALTQPQPLNLKEIQEQVLDADTLLLEYALGKERSYLWLVSQTGIQSFELPKQAVIEDAANRFYRLVSKRGDDSPESTAQFWQQAATLSRMILAPVEAKLADKRLLVVAEGALQYVPFSALPLQSNKQITALALPKDKKSETTRTVLPRPTLVLEKHEVIPLPSASVLAVLRKELKQRKQAGKLIAVFADPVYKLQDERLTNYNARVREKVSEAQNRSLERTLRDFLDADGRWNLDRLDNSLAEARAIQNLTTNNDAMIALDFKASRANVMESDLSDFRIVHFATHGLLNSRHPDLSGLVLSLVNEKGETQDGFLRLNDVYNLKLSADLVVLSACETALGNNIRGEGLVGLTRGFMYAGTARGLASLWKVNDQKTAELMGRFYEKLLKEKLPASKALRLAQLEMWQQNRKNAPFYWAAFILQGEWQQPLPNEDGLNKTDEQRRASRTNRF